MTEIIKRYASAIASKNMRSNPRTDMSDSDVIGAVGLAGKVTRTEVVNGQIAKRKGAPLAMALMRLFAGDGRAVSEIVQILAGLLASKAWHSMEIVIARVDAEDIARAVLAWHRYGVCKPCGGHGYLLVNGKLGYGRAVVGDAQCPSCRGTRKVPFDGAFAPHQVEMALWLREYIEREQYIAGAEAMKALRPKLDL